MATKFDGQKFFEDKDFRLWRIKLEAILKQQG